MATIAMPNNAKRLSIFLNAMQTAKNPAISKVIDDVNDAVATEIVLGAAIKLIEHIDSAQNVCIMQNKKSNKRKILGIVIIGLFMAPDKPAAIRNRLVKPVTMTMLLILRKIRLSRYKDSSDPASSARIARNPPIIVPCEILLLISIIVFTNPLFFGFSAISATPLLF